MPYPTEQYLKYQFCVIVAEKRSSVWRKTPLSAGPLSRAGDFFAFTADPCRRVLVQRERGAKSFFAP